MPSGSVTLGQAVRVLRKHYGRPEPLPTADPFELIVLENVAYLASPARRRNAFEQLKRTVGTSPAALETADLEAMQRATAMGILNVTAAAKLRKCAEIAIEHFGGDLGPVVRGNADSAKRALRRFPGIGEPGAEKILLFTGQQPLLAPESNGLRVLVRLGIVREAKTYSATYAAGRDAATGLSPNPRVVQEAHLLLQQHGQTLCKRTAPKCAVCPLATMCAYAFSMRSSGKR